MQIVPRLGEGNGFCRPWSPRPMNPMAVDVSTGLMIEPFQGPEERANLRSSKAESARRLKTLGREPSGIIAAQKGHDTADVVRFT
jgi:hypothetical protein